MVPLLIANVLVWTKIYRDWKRDGEISFDPDMDKLFDSPMTIKLGFLPPIPELSDTEVQRTYEEWIQDERRKSELEDYLWKEGVMLPADHIFCNGSPLEPCNPEDVQRFMIIKNQAMLEGMYNSKNLDDGGEHDLYKAWLMMKGCSDYGAEQLLEIGVVPWEFDF